MTEDFWWQAGTLMFLALCFFSEGARQNKLEMNRQTWLEIAGMSVATVLVFALMTGGRGCTSASRFDPDTCIADTGC